MSATLTPPPVTPAPASPQPPSSARAMAIIAMVLGAIVIVSTATFSAIGMAFSGLHSTSYAVDVANVNSLDVQLAAGGLQVEYAGVEKAELDVQSSVSTGPWTLRVDGSKLVVASPDNRFGWPNLFGMADKAVLRLPTSLQGMDATMRVAAGSLTVNGQFGDVNLDVQAGSASVDGIASGLDAKVSAGSGDINVEGVVRADLTVEAGSMSVAIRGAQPDSTAAHVAAGSLDLAVPQGAYDVTSNVSAGRLDNQLGSQPGASSTIRVDMSAGTMTLRSSD